MGGNSSQPETKPLYLSTCKCGTVQIELYDEPLLNVVCYCDDCQAAAAYVELKRKAAGRPNTCPCLEENPENRGICSSFFYLEKMRFVKGMDQMKAFRNSPSASCIRPYTACCNTIMIVVGGSKVPYNFRVINSNTLTAATTRILPHRMQSGDRFKPEFAWKMQGKSGNIDFWATVTEEDGIVKHDGIPTDVATLFLSHNVFGFAYPGKGEYASNKDIVGINSDPADFEEVNPISTYHSIGVKQDQAAW